MTNGTFTKSLDQQFKANQKGSYLCNADTKTELDGPTLETQDFQYAAFQDGIDKFSSDST